MTADEAAKLIAPKLGLSLERDRTKLYDTLTLVNNKAWKESAIRDNYKHFHVEVKKDHKDQYYFIAPHDYNILEAINVNGQPVDIKDKWFQFHKNARGSIEQECCSGNWIRDVVSLGETPVINQPRYDHSGPIKIGARSVNPEFGEIKLLVKGTDIDGNRVQTYRKNEKGETETVIGVELAVDETIRIIDNINWGWVESIEKNVSLNDIEILAIHFDSTIQVLTRMRPESKESRLRKYLVPDNCKFSCVHGIFRRSKPEPIYYGTQRMIISDEEAILSLAVGVDYLFDKKAPDESLPFSLNGLKSLNDEKMKIESPSATVIQVSGTEDYGDEEFSNY